MRSTSTAFALPANALEELSEHEREDGAADTREQVRDAEITTSDRLREPGVDEQRAGVDKELTTEQTHDDTES